MEGVRALLEQLAQLEANHRPGGEQFYQRRLRRAAKVPAAEAAPEVGLGHRCLLRDGH